MRSAIGVNCHVTPLPRERSPIFCLGGRKSAVSFICQASARIGNFDHQGRMIRNTVQPLLMQIPAGADSRQQGLRCKCVIDAIGLPASTPCVFDMVAMDVPPCVCEAAFLQGDEAIYITEIIERPHRRGRYQC